MNKTILFVLILVFIISLTPGLADARLVACVGSSTTYGYGLPDRASNCYPAQLARMLQGFDSKWETQNFGVNGTCVLRKGSAPYITTSAFHDVLAYEPDVVVIQLGVNDSMPNNWRYKDDFIPDFLVLIDAFAQLPSQPKIYIWYPKPVFSSPWGHSNSVIRYEIIPLISQLPIYRDVQVIDLYTPLKELRHLFQTDGVHLNTEGTRLAAEIVAAAVLGRPAHPDLNGDGIVDCADMCIMVDHWHTDDPSCDIAPPRLGDGIVDVQDLVVLSEHLFEEILPLELIAYWKLDEAEGDIAYDSAEDKDGSLFGGPLWRPVGGIVDGALQLDGVDDCVITNAILDPADGPFSIFAWINGGAPGQVIVSQQGAADWLAADAEGNLITELKGTGRSAGPLFSETIITDGQWHRIGLVWDGSHRTLYVNGVVVADDTQPGLESSQMGLYIGTGKAMESGTYFSGLIDDIRIYNVALNAEQIAALAQ